jgi:hypothetical protein
LTIRLDHPERRPQNTHPSSYRRLIQLIDEICRHGDCAVSEDEFLKRAREQTIDDPRTGLSLAIRNGDVYREIIDGETLLFPGSLRDAELTITRCARHIAEGAIGTQHSAIYEKFRLVTSTNHGSTIDYLAILARDCLAQGVGITVLAPDKSAARWFEVKSGVRVTTNDGWLTGKSTRLVAYSEPLVLDARDETKLTCPTDSIVLVVLDASRLGVEHLARLLDAVSPVNRVLLIGNPTEPAHGHGQPFSDLVASRYFETTHLAIGKAHWGSDISAPAARRRKSGLAWRLTRACGP